MSKSVEFKRTTKGYVLEVNGKSKWFIQISPISRNKFWVHEEVDGSGGYLLRGIVDTLQEAKAFVYERT